VTARDRRIEAMRRADDAADSLEHCEAMAPHSLVLRLLLPMVRAAVRCVRQEEDEARVASPRTHGP
jgi:hypothetical protein